MKVMEVGHLEPRHPFDDVGSGLFGGMKVEGNAGRIAALCGLVWEETSYLGYFRIQSGNIVQ